MSQHKCVNLLHLFELIKEFYYLYDRYGLLKQTFNMRTIKHIIISIVLLLFASNTFAEDETIEMLNKLENSIKLKKLLLL